MTQSHFSVVGLRPAVMLVGFLEGLFQRADVAEWAAAEVARHDAVPDALLGLTPITGRDDAEIERALTKLAGPVPQNEIARLTIDVLIASRTDGICAPRAARQERTLVGVGERTGLDGGGTTRRWHRRPSDSTPR